MFLVFVSQHVWGGVGNLTWPSQGFRGAYERKNPIGTRMLRFSAQLAREIPFRGVFFEKKTGLSSYLRVFLLEIS